MENTLLKQFNFNIKQIIVDEIALDGLEGIGLDLLWRRLEVRLSTPVTEKMKIRFWRIILNSAEISLYQLPEPLPAVEVLDRFDYIDEETGYLKDSNKYVDGPYEFCLIKNEWGSCKNYEVRKLIPSNLLLDIAFEKIINEYGGLLVLVASIEERWQALAGHVPINSMYQLPPLQYCVLELIGRSRHNGQMTTGTTNLLKIEKNPKNLFYIRQCLKDLNLIKSNYATQIYGDRGIKSILIRLVRFYKPNILTLPKNGRIYDIVQYLKKQPDYKEKTDVVWKNGFLSKRQLKKLKNSSQLFEIEEKTETDEIKTKKNFVTQTRKRRYISLAPKSDESSHSEDEQTETTIECQHKVCVSILRQSYDRFLDAGLKGLTLIELAQLVGIQFYTARSICRTFSRHKIIREYFEDRGKQRVARYVAIAAGRTDEKYDAEKQTFLEYMNQNANINEIKVETPSTSTAQNNEISNTNTEDTQEDVASKLITEVRTLDGVEKPEQQSLKYDENLTLRQLKMANGLLKIIKEKKCLTGYVAVSNLIAKEINETPMASKALKYFLQRLVNAGLIKIYKIRWPGFANPNYINVICAPNIKSTDPIVRAKYKEVYLKATQKKKAVIKKDVPDKAFVQLSTLIQPRYMKVQNLHQLIVKLVYFEPPPDCSQIEKGCMTVFELIPEMTVKLAISNMSTPGLAEIAHLRIEEKQLDLKLRDAPPEISHHISKCKSLRNGIRMVLSSLAMNGLIQLIYQPDMHSVEYSNNYLSKFLFYVNRNAKIINTTGEWPRENVDIKSLEKSYYFGTMDDVKRYWNDVYDISVATKVLLTKRTKKKLYPPARREEDIVKYDNGDVYGNGKGPCGFDSCFYMDIPHLWHTFYIRNKNNKKETPKPKTHQIKVPKKAKICKPKIKPKKVKSTTVSVVKPKPQTIRKRTKDSSSIPWSEKEDYVLMLCMTATAIASPSMLPGTLRVRNRVAKDILNKFDPRKTPSLCHRRSIVISQYGSLMHEKDCLLSEMRRRRQLIVKYEGLLKKLRLKYSTNISKFINESRLPMLELVHLIWQVSKTESYSNRQPPIAIDMDTIKDLYTIVPSSATNMYNLYKAPDLMHLRESVFLTVMITYQNEIKTDMAKKIYSIFKLYPENSLRIVVDQLRKCGAVSAKEKLFNNQMHRLHLEDIVQSAYKISAKYQQRWLGNVYLEFLDTLAGIIDEGIPTDNIKGTAYLNCVLCELQGCNYIKIMSARKPNIVGTQSYLGLNVLDIEWNFKLNSGTIACLETTEGSFKRNQSGKLDVSVLYKDIEYEAVLEELSNNCIVHVDENMMYDLQDPIIKYVYEKKEEGITFKELQKKTGQETKDLIQKLQQLESENILKRVGYINNIIILVKYIHSWALKVDDKYVIVTPWLNMEFKIRQHIMLEWAGTIANKIFECPGSSIQYLSDSFELITTRAIQDICIFLRKCGCLTLHTLNKQEQNIFSDEDELPTLTEYNPYATPEEIIVFPSKNLFTRFAYLRKTMMEAIKK